MVNFDQGKRNLVRDSGEFDFSEFQLPGFYCNHRHLVSSVGSAQVCEAGGRRFNPRPDQTSGSLND